MATEEDKKKKEKEDATKALAGLNFKKVTVDEVKGLLAKEAPIEVRDSYGETPLIRAIMAQNIEVASYLISQSANIYETNLSGQTTMIICAKEGLLSLVKDLFKHGYDFNKPLKTTDQSVLSQAVWGNQEEVVRFLLENGANVNVIDNQGWTPLMVASYLGCVQIAKVLLDHGADTKPINKQKMTALDLATFYKHSEIAELLLGKTEGA